MKSFVITLFLAVAVTQIVAQVPSFGRCPQTTVIQNFNVPRYLGRWFEISSYPATFALGVSCAEANYSLNPNGTVAVLNKGVRLGQVTSDLGVAELVQEGQGKLIVNFPVSPNTATEPNYFILGTDYINFAVVHSCRQVSRFTNVQFAWVLSRSRTLSRISSRRVQNILAQNSIETDPFRETSQTNCGLLP